jgi:filamentous hemagglutinin family protein
MRAVAEEMFAEACLWARRRRPAPLLVVASMACAAFCAAPTEARGQPTQGWDQVRTQIWTDRTLAGTGPLEILDNDLDRVYEIPESLGAASGPNLFHSFEDFQLRRLDTARFTSTHSYDHVISRVTGGTTSHINGNLESTIRNASGSGADFFFLNPSGVVFGPDAAINVPASFHVSTGTILVENSQLRLPEPGRVLELVGRDGPEGAAGVTLRGASLVAPGGRVRMVSTGSAERVAIAQGIETTGGEQPTGTLGTLVVEADSQVEAGKIDAAARWMRIDDSELLAEGMEGNPVGASIEIESEHLAVSGAELRSASSSAEIASISVRSDDITLSGRTLLAAVTGAEAEGDTPAIDIRGGSLRLEEFAQIRSGPRAPESGAGGDIYIEVDSLHLDDAPNLIAGDRILTNSTSFGSGGDITVLANDLVTLKGGSQIVTESSGPNGVSGDIHIEARELVLDGTRPTGLPSHLSLIPFTEIRTEKNDPLTQGSSGDITIEVDRLEVTNGAQIQTRSAGDGNAGDIIVTVPRMAGADPLDSESQGVILRGSGLVPECLDGHCTNRPDRRPAGIASLVDGGGHAGNISVTSPSVLLDVGVIELRTGMASPPDGAEPPTGGSIEIRSGELVVTGQVERNTRRLVLARPEIRSISSSRAVAPIRLLVDDITLAGDALVTSATSAEALGTSDPAPSPAPRLEPAATSTSKSTTCISARRSWPLPSES